MKLKRKSRKINKSTGIKEEKRKKEEEEKR